MAKILILCFIVINICDAGLLPNNFVYSQFPYLNTVYHGEGATSYQNVHFSNYGSVPIPKNLQVDDGHSYNIDAHDEIISSPFDYSPHSHELENHAFVASGAPHIDVADHIDLPPHYDPTNHHKLYDHDVEYEYH